jgi:nucleoside-triphosphatase
VKSLVKNNIVITGQVGVGKTTMVKHLLQQLSNDWAGYFTERILDGKTTIAHQMVTSDGREEIFAHRDWTHLPQIGPMGVRLEVFENLGVSILRQARQTSKLIVMDELGFMEEKARHFIQEVITCFDCPVPVVAVIKERAANHWDILMSRQDYWILTVTHQDRNYLRSVLIDKVKVPLSQS